MRIKNFKFEDIAYYVDNLKPILENKINQLDVPIVVVKNPKKFAMVSINIIYLSCYFFLVTYINNNFNCSLTFNLIFSVLILLFLIYLNSKIVYVFNNRLKLFNDINQKEIEEGYNENFDSILINEIKEINFKLNLNGKIDIIILFLYVQHFVLTKRISNSELIKQINCSFEFDRFSEAYYSQIANDLFDWKDEKSKKKIVNNVSKYSSHFDKFKEIEEKFNGFRR